MANTRLNRVGDVVTLNEIVARFDAATEYRFERRCRGTLKDLDATPAGAQSVRTRMSGP